MNADKVLLIIALDIGVLAVILVLVVLWMRRLIAGLGQSIGESGEAIVIGPQKGMYLKQAGIASLKTCGAIALTDQRLVFRKPIGGDISLPISEIEYISRKRWYKGNYHGGRDFLILEMTDGSEVAFMVKDPDLWTQKMLDWEEPK